MPCALCSSDAPLIAYPVPGGPEEATAHICATCAEQIDGTPDPDHWRCLASSMWSEDPATQVLAARMLARLAPEHGWAQDLADQLWLDDDTRAWADNDPQDSGHRDSNGAVLEAVDSVTLIKDLNVKGANFTAKRGTPVRNISLVQDNPEQIEGRVEGQRIVILTQFVKKN